MDRQLWMYTIDSAFYGQSIHKITDLNFQFQFISQFGFHTSDNGLESQAQFSILRASIWKRWLTEKTLRTEVEETDSYLPLATCIEAIFQTFWQAWL